MKLPKTLDTCQPILEILSNDQSLNKKDLRIQVRDKYYSALPEDLLNQVTKTGPNALLHRIHWATSHLKLAKFVHYPERGRVQITEKGKSALLKGKITSKDIIKDPDYLAHVANRKTKTRARKVDNVTENTDNDADLKGASPQELIDKGLSAIEEQTKDELLDKLKEINPYYFERVILELFKKMGYGDFLETPKSGDGGIDGVINSDQLGLEKIYTQAKRYSETDVSEKEIRNFIGAMSGDTNKGIFVTTSNFHRNAQEKASQAHHSIILIDGSKLVDLMYQHNIGVQTQQTYETKIIDEDFFDQE